MSTAANQFGFLWNFDQKVEHSARLNCCCLNFGDVLISNSHFRPLLLQGKI